MQLERGSHPDETGTCLMELVSMLLGATKTDTPECVSVVVSSVSRRVNDWLEDDERHRLAVLIPRIMRCRREPKRVADRVKIRVALWAARSIEHTIDLDDTVLQERVRRVLEVSEAALWDGPVDASAETSTVAWVAAHAGCHPQHAIRSAMHVAGRNGDDLVLWLDDLIDAWHKAMVEEGCEPEDPTIDYPSDDEINEVVAEILASRTQYRES